MRKELFVLVIVLKVEAQRCSSRFNLQSAHSQ
jgi:hypothetical protein